MMHSSPILTDRSRIEAAKKCPRLRYYGYEALGTGLQLGSAVPLDVGSCFHAAAESVLLEIRDGDPPMWAHILEIALASAHAGEAWTRLLPADQAVVDALVRTWWAVGLPQLKGWRVLEVEREEIFDYSVPVYQYEPAPPGAAANYPVFKEHAQAVQVMSRLDLLAEALPGATVNGKPVAAGFYIWNWKTARRIDDKWRDKWNWDAQLMTEVLGVEQRLGQTITGVVIMGIVKENHPLINTWHNRETGEFTSRYEWTCDSPHPFRYAKGGMCPGGKRHYLSKKEWERVPVPDQQAELERILREDPTLLQEWIETVGPFRRVSNYEIEMWCAENLPREAEIAAVRSAKPLDDATLWRMFPRHTGDNCIWPSECPAKDLCWSGKSMYDVPSRVPHHKPERVSWEKR